MTGMEAVAGSLCDAITSGSEQDAGTAVSLFCSYPKAKEKAGWLAKTLNRIARRQSITVPDTPRMPVQLAPQVEQWPVEAGAFGRRPELSTSFPQTVYQSRRLCIRRKRINDNLGVSTDTAERPLSRGVGEGAEKVDK